MPRPSCAKGSKGHVVTTKREVKRKRRVSERRKRVSRRSCQTIMATSSPPVRFVPRGWCTLGWWYARAARARDGRLRPAELRPAPGSAGGRAEAALDRDQHGARARRLLPRPGGA